MEEHNIEQPGPQIQQSAMIIFQDDNSGTAGGCKEITKEPFGNEKENQTEENAIIRVEDTRSVTPTIPKDNSDKSTGRSPKNWKRRARGKKKVVASPTGNGAGTKRGLFDDMDYLVEKTEITKRHRSEGNKNREDEERLGFDGLFIVNCEGKSGGLMLLWKIPLIVTIRSYSVGHVDCVVNDGDKEWRFMGFYGHPEVSKRRHSWDLMRKLASIEELKNLPLSWGDFNEICSHKEKMGGRRKPESHIDEFNKVIEECELREIYGKGDWFTWVNKRAGDELIFEKLDRFLSTLQWRLLYPTAIMRILEFYSSDHRAVSIIWQRERNSSTANKHQGTKRVKFEKFWSVESDCYYVVERGWNKEGNDTSLERKLENCKNELRRWADNKFHHLPRHLKQERDKLNALKHSKQWRRVEMDIADLEKKVEKLATQEEMFWKQRSRNNWLKHGDRNTPYFHSQASRRKRINTIKGLASKQGDFCTNTTTMGDIIVDYFSEIFTSTNPSQEDMDTVIKYEIVQQPLPTNSREDCRYWSNNQASMVTTINWVDELLYSFRIANQMVGIDNLRDAETEARWRKPVANFFRLDVDACFNVKEH
ncbi:hypothetical protein DH2020_001224 [Rehmannia glutinosa]|uniref:Endonuclease/exonuclease/phosphatase domain-containing protein n=1 Tax=Rehmannia glutinosa TaxID=99300 RepID=A0ABR0XZG3_REHGL